MIPSSSLDGPAAWRGAELASSESWIYRLSASELAEIEAAMRGIEAGHVDIASIRRETFPLPGLGPRLAELLQEIIFGRGFVLVRGLPVQRYTATETAIAFWGIGAHLGRALPQNGKGHLLGHVRDFGRDPNDPTYRLYQTAVEMTFHSDSCDVVGLMCRNKARSGGQSLIVSSVSVCNAMTERRPDLARLLFGLLATDRRGEIPAGAKPYYVIPVFNYDGRTITTMYNREYIESAQRFAEVTRLTPTHLEAFALFDSLCDELKLAMDLVPGDMQFLHNHQILHARTAYEDWPDDANKRHLLRLWLCPPIGRTLPSCFAERYGSIAVGNRGGVVVPGAETRVPLEPEG
ncbi:MAG: TauD/TfdA family dioxygenase [Rhodospirillales bacterium]|nr:TauD/TfdA family dioxygenase [Rhodospirillales bacterium]